MASLDNTLVRGFYAFERKFYTEMDRRLGIISNDLYRREMARYHSDPDVHRAAELWSYALRDPRYANDSAFLARMAGIGSAIFVAGKSPVALTALPKKLSRRALVIAGTPLYAAALSSMYGCESSYSPTTPTLPPPTPPPPTPPPIGDALELEGDLEGLIRQTKVNGAMHVPGALETVAIVNGHYKVEKKHGIRTGIYPNTVIETAEGVKRITTVEANPSGFMIDIGYRKVHLDVIDDLSLFNLWARLRRPLGSERWDRYASNIQRFFYDASKWAATPQGWVVEQNYRPRHQASVDNVISVALNDIEPYSFGLTTSKVLLRESQTPNGPRPQPREAGWVVYMLGGPFAQGIQQSDDGGFNGEIKGAFMLLNDTIDIHILRGSISTDTFESVTGAADATTQTGYRPINADGWPTDEGKKLAMIQYMRKILNIEKDGVRDFQT